VCKVVCFFICIINRERKSLYNLKIFELHEHLYFFQILRVLMTVTHIQNIPFLNFPVSYLSHLNHERMWCDTTNTIPTKAYILSNAFSFKD